MKSFVFPGNIEEEILAIGSQQIPYMRTAWFSDLVMECESLLLALADCPQGRVIPYTASGTAAMESCVVHLRSKCRRALVVNGGTFGARWAQMCGYHGVAHDEFPVGFGQEPDLERLEGELSRREHDVLFMQHHETSSGHLLPIREVGRMCQRYGQVLVVDAIGSFLTDPLSMTQCSVDVAVISTQKGLNLPPGLSFVILSPKVLAVRPFSPGVFYTDWDRQLDNLLRGQTPFSPATQLFMQLRERLRRVQSAGVGKAVQSVERKARSFRNACRSRQWTFSTCNPSNCITGVILPCPARPVVEHLACKHVYVMPSCRENLIRVSHTGSLTEDDGQQLAELLARCVDSQPV